MLCDKCPNVRIGWCAARWDGCDDACRLIGAPGVRHALIETTVWEHKPTDRRVAALRAVIDRVNRTGGCLPMTAQPMGQRLNLGPTVSHEQVFGVTIRH